MIDPFRPILEPEDLRTRVAPARPTSQAPRPPHASISGREDAAALSKDFGKALSRLEKQRQTGAAAPLRPTDPAHALAQLQQQRESGAPAPPPPPSRPSSLGLASETQRMGTDSPRRLPSVTPLGTKDSHGVPTAAALAMEMQSRAVPTEMQGSRPPIQPIVPSTKSITSPLGALNLKPGTTSLSPSRTPGPMAIVGGSLKINSPDKPISPSGPPPATLLAAIDANAPKTPTKDSFVPPSVPMPIPAPPSTGKSLAPSVPAVPSSRPNTTPKSFPPPAGGPPASYERAFRQWSSPNLSAADESSPGNVGPVTFQVYTAQDISAGRAPVRSLPAIAREPKKASLGARIGMAAVGGVIVLLTAAAVIAVSTEDPKHPAPSATVAPPPPSVTSEPTPAPTAISIGDPAGDTIDELPATPPPPPPRVASPGGSPTAAPKPKPKPATMTTTPTAPASLKGMAPPPNPYGK